MIFKLLFDQHHYKIHNLHSNQVNLLLLVLSKIFKIFSLSYQKIMNIFHINQNNHQLKTIMSILFIYFFSLLFSHLIHLNFTLQDDLNECHSRPSSYLRDSGISIQTNISFITSANQKFHQLQSTRTHSDDLCSLFNII